ncbi:MAG: hypothetical protein ACLRY6_17535 [[Clostridium] innocuum]
MTIKYQKDAISLVLYPRENTMDTGYNSNVFLKAGSTAACLLMVSVDYHNGTAG